MMLTPSFLNMHYVLQIHAKCGTGNSNMHRTYQNVGFKNVANLFIGSYHEVLLIKSVVIRELQLSLRVSTSNPYDT